MPSLALPLLRRAAGPAFLASLLAGCAVGPNYHRPDAAAPTAFKEAAGWKAAAPGDTLPRGAWWEAFQDPVLNGLEAQVATSNQTLQQAAANYEEARQLARADRGQLLPEISLGGSAERAQSPTGRIATSSTGGGTSVTTSGIQNTFSATLQATWSPDFWGKVRRQLESDVASAQASAADLANSRLSLQTELATDYVELRVLDEKRRLLDNAVAGYDHTLRITRNKYDAGVSARSDVISAQAQLDATRAQAVDTGVQRAQLEHAIAVLIGRPPSALTIAPRDTLEVALPAIPPQVPSALLERRPDVAASEREVASANARVGVAFAGYFPDITGSADGGFEGSKLYNLIELPNRFWSLGGNVSETLFNAGATHDEVLEAKASYEASVANYRQTVLSALQQVDDNLAALRLYASERTILDAAVAEAAQASQITLNEYSAGTIDYTSVVTAEVNELNDRESALTVRQAQLTASVALIEALGGGWSSADLPDGGAVLRRASPNGAAVAASPIE
jgi:NodT family efflux transporter outer membrane factor (OMF) lipoprotein